MPDFIRQQATDERRQLRLYLTWANTKLTNLAELKLKVKEAMKEAKETAHRYASVSGLAPDWPSVSRALHSQAWSEAQRLMTAFSKAWSKQHDKRARFQKKQVAAANVAKQAQKQKAKKPAQKKPAQKKAPQASGSNTKGKGNAKATTKPRTRR